MGIYLVPTLVVYGCILPAVYVVQNALQAHWGSVLCVALSLLAMLMQVMADVEMHRFRKQRNTPFISVGLWKYSRHPNYLGEILMWWGVALAVWCAAPSRPLLCAGALANTVLFFAVSIPMADRRQARKPGFEAYKARTRMLLPIKKWDVPQP